MRLKFSATFLMLFLLALAQPLFARTNPETLALKAVSENSAESAPAIAELRAQGPAGLNALFQTHASEINFRMRIVIVEGVWRAFLGVV